MRYEQRDDSSASVVTTGLRQRHAVVDGEFEVPDDLEPGAHQRLIGAGHVPVEPDRLPSGVKYPPEEGGGEEQASGSESDSSGSAGEESDGSEEGEETGEAPEEMPAPPEPLSEMNRSEMYRYANDDLGLGLEWSGDDALNSEEMRERIEEVLNGE